MGKYSTHILELVRNNGIAGEMQEDVAVFFMFDYFDLLFYKRLEGESKKYTEYLALNDAFKNEKDYKVSFKYLSLYQYLEKETSNPFEINRNKESLSENPFLGLIQVSLCKDSFIKFDANKDSVDSFLNLCEDKILETVFEVKKSGEYSIEKFQIYRSSTTGDFCLALRTDSVETIYSIAVAINNRQNKDDISFLTYTSVGIECCRKENGQYCTLSNDFVIKHQDLYFALRFSADYQLENQLNKYRGKNGESDQWCQVTKGLFGRYDYLLNIKIEEFKEIYPVLCERKIGGYKSSDKQYDKTNFTLRNIMKYPNIRNINERILVNLYHVEKEVICNIDEAERKKNVQIKNLHLYEKIVKLRDNYLQYFSEENRAFLDLARGTIEIFKAFSALGMERDAYMNWLVFYKDMEILCNCIKKWMDSYEEIAETEEEQKRRLREKVLVNWRVNLQSINQYTRLLQNVNYQTYQSPIYEIQTQIDTEKIMVAYREAMGVYLQKQNPMEAGEEGEDRIYPDFNKDIVEVKAPFSVKDDNLYVKEREIVCTVPSFEYFGRLYDLLPWIIHESSHYIRVMERKVRNDFLVEYVFKCVFNKVVTDIIGEVAKGTIDRNLQIVKRRLAKSMAIVAKREVLKDKKVNDEEQQDDFEQIIRKMALFLDEICPDNQKNLFGNRSQSEKKERKAIIDALLDFYRKAEIVDGFVLNKLYSLSAGKEEESALSYVGALDIIEKLIADLLVHYNDDLFEKLGSKELKACMQNELITIKDFQISALWYEDRLFNCVNNLLQDSKINEKHYTVIKEYCVLVKQVYTLYLRARDLTWQNGKMNEKSLEDFLKNVYEKYDEVALDENRFKKQLDIMMDPDCYYTLRCLGLLNGEKKVFSNKMTGLFQKMNGEMIQQYKIFWTRIYRESCADLLMVTSLNMKSFGYCRQVLQTISDTKVERGTYEYEDVNYERFRIVTAVLLSEEGATAELDFWEEGLRINAESLVENARQYCVSTLKCIRRGIFKNLEQESMQKRSTDKKKKLVEDLLGDINAQISKKLESLNESAYKNTLLYAILHEGSSCIDEKMRKNVLNYKEIERYYTEYKYSLWRLEWLCKGINNIVQNGYVEVSKDFFDHLSIIRKQVKEKHGKGCEWEKGLPDYLLKAKMDVGNFYNDPAQVDQKTSEEKLENTIEFIQNYYYYNRFRLTKGGIR